MFTQELAIDLGTANTVIFQNDQIVLDEPSIVAVENSTGKLIALGQKAKRMQEKENPGIKTVRPLRGGVIADFNAAEMMIRGFIKQANSNRSFLFSPNRQIVVGILCGAVIFMIQQPMEDYFQQLIGADGVVQHRPARHVR